MTIVVSLTVVSSNKGSQTSGISPYLGHVSINSNTVLEKSVNNEVLFYNFRLKMIKLDPIN